MNRENLHAHIDYELITAVHLGANASKKAKSTTNATIVSRAPLYSLWLSALVLCQSSIDGYSFLSLMRASSVVNRHWTVARFSFLWFCHA